MAHHGHHGRARLEVFGLFFQGDFADDVFLERDDVDDSVERFRETRGGRRIERLVDARKDPAIQQNFQNVLGAHIEFFRQIADRNSFGNRNLARLAWRRRGSALNLRAAALLADAHACADRMQLALAFFKALLHRGARPGGRFAFVNRLAGLGLWRSLVRRQECSSASAGTRRARSLMQWLACSSRHRLPRTALSWARRKSRGLANRPRAGSRPWRSRWIHSRTRRQWIPIWFGRRRSSLSAGRRPRGCSRLRCGRRRRSCMARGHRCGCGRLRGCRRSLRWRSRNRRTRRRLGNGWAWRWRTLRGLRGWNDRRPWNGWSRSRRCGFSFDRACRRRCRTARFGDSRSGWMRNRWRSRRRSDCGGLHASRSGGCFFRCFIRYCFLFGRCFLFGECAKVIAHFYRGFYLNRAGMRLLLGDAGFGQIVNDDLCLDLELASQFVDSDLVRIGHCPPGLLLVSVLV